MDAVIHHYTNVYMIYFIVCYDTPLTYTRMDLLDFVECRSPLNYASMDMVDFFSHLENHNYINQVWIWQMYEVFYN